MFKLGTCSTGIKLLKDGRKFTAFDIFDETELDDTDRIICVHKDDIIDRNHGIYTVLNNKPIEIIR